MTSTFKHIIDGMEDAVVSRLIETTIRSGSGGFVRDILRKETEELLHSVEPGRPFTNEELDEAIRLLYERYQHIAASRQPAPRRMSYVGMAARTVAERYDRDRLELEVARCSGFVKMMCGVANNCAIGIVNWCRSEIADIRDEESYKERPRSPHPGYRHRAKKLFTQFFEEWHSMEAGLLHPATGHTRFFHVDDMDEVARKRYGTMTDAEYFEFWKGTGSLAMAKSKPLVTSLQNKFRLSLERHGVRHAQQTAWAMTADAVLQLAVETWERTMRSCHEALPMLELSFVEKIWAPFSPKTAADLWRKALLLMAPECDGYKLEDYEERNIAYGLQQLRELWISSDLPFDATIRAVEDYDEDIFRTRGEAKKSMRELAEMRNDARKEIDAERRRRKEEQRKQIA